MQIDFSDIEDLWVFGYGSLMWRPGFEYVEKAPAKCVGYQRSFCIYSTIYRGTPEKAGLVLGLDEGGETYGMAFRIAREKQTEVMEYLREREQINDVYIEVLHPMEVMGHGTLNAICYVATKGHEQYAGGLSLEDQAKIIATASGKMGANSDYLFNSYETLVGLEIWDEELAKLTDMVKEIHK
ncbi:MAG: gamma-glutamylcyclotransferase [Alphaproteobacteria bacterium]|nr:gamma-glutamylcyclotransferase [Alphaproteobacteria bacterium]